MGFLWPIPDRASLESMLSENQSIIATIQTAVPTYHHRALRRQFGKISRFSNLALLRGIYRQATNDHSASLTTSEE